MVSFNRNIDIKIPLIQGTSNIENPEPIREEGATTILKGSRSKRIEIWNILKR
jgi:hypothetical protein